MQEASYFQLQPCYGIYNMPSYTGDLTRRTLRAVPCCAVLQACTRACTRTASWALASTRPWQRPARHCCSQESAPTPAYQSGGSFTNHTRAPHTHARTRTQALPCAAGSQHDRARRLTHPARLASPRVHACARRYSASDGRQGNASFDACLQMALSVLPVGGCTPDARNARGEQLPGEATARDGSALPTHDGSPDGQRRGERDVGSDATSGGASPAAQLEDVEGDGTRKLQQQQQEPRTGAQHEPGCSMGGVAVPQLSGSFLAVENLAWTAQVRFYDCFTFFFNTVRITSLRGVVGNYNCLITRVVFRRFSSF
jgi:hypothetical protein